VSVPVFSASVKVEEGRGRGKGRLRERNESLASRFRAGRGSARRRPEPAIIHYAVAPLLALSLLSPTFVCHLVCHLASRGLTLPAVSEESGRSSSSSLLPPPAPSLEQWG
jgi:hypothetical protein